MADPSFKLRAGQSGPGVKGTPGNVLTFNADGESVSGQPGGGAGAVASVFGRIGAVIATLGDYSAQLVSYAGAVTGATQVKAALDSLQGQITALPASPVASVFGRIGAVVATLGDYSAQLVSYAGDVTGATQVKAALDSLQGQITALPAGGVAPLEIVESANTGFYDVAGSTVVFWLKQNGGAPIECSFAAWNPGDILRASAFINASTFGPSAPLTMLISMVVSLDGGATWQQLTPALAAFDVGDPAPVGNAPTFSIAFSGSVALASTPLVRIQNFMPRGHMEVDFENNSGVQLCCERFAAGAYTPAGALF